MKYQTKERKPSQRPHSVPGSICLAWAPQLFQKGFLHTLDFPYFSISLAVLATQIGQFWDVELWGLNAFAWLSIPLPSQPITHVLKSLPSWTGSIEDALQFSEKRSYMYNCRHSIQWAWKRGNSKFLCSHFTCERLFQHWGPEWVIVVP